MSEIDNEKFGDCNNVAENYRLDITYENNLIIKLVLVSVLCMIIFCIK